MPSINVHSPGNQKRIATILELMKDGPVLVTEITEYFDTHPDVIRAYFRHLLKTKQIYISNYVVEKHGLSRLYDLGNKKSVDRKAVINSVMPTRKSNARILRELEQKKTKKKTNIKVKPDIAAEWMFNPC